MAENNTITPQDRLVRRRHPEYENHEEHWEFLESCYEGGRSWFTDNIFKYFKEGDGEYTDRIGRAYRFNHSREVVDLVNKYLFRATILRNEKDAPESVKSFWRQATKNGMDVDAFVRQAARRSSIFGRVYIVVDNNITREILSIADQKKSKARTYAYVVKPLDVLDMSFDDMGHLNWILIREYWRDDTDPLDDDEGLEERFRLWTKSEWFLFEYDKNKDTNKDSRPVVKLVGSGTHGLEEVPVVILDHMEDDNLYTSPALINDIAYLDRAVANYLSNLDAIIQDQTFSQLAMPAQGVMPGDETSAKKQLIELGTKRIFIYNGEGGVAPTYLSPDPRQAELIITAINKIISEIYHTVGMAGERTKQDNAMGIDNSSGVAKAFDFDRVNALLSSKATGLEHAEKKIINLVSKWNGDTLDEEKEYVVYPDNFDIRGLLDEFDIAQRLAVIQAPDEVRKKQMEMVVDKLFPAGGEELRATLLASIKSWDLDPLKEMGETQDSNKGPTQGSNQSE